MTTVSAENANPQPGRPQRPRAPWRLGAAGAAALLGLVQGCGAMSKADSAPPPAAAALLSVCTLPSPREWQRVPPGANVEKIAGKLGVNALRVWGGAMLTMTCDNEQIVRQADNGMSVEVLSEGAKSNLSNSCLAVAGNTFLSPDPAPQQVDIICPAADNPVAPTKTK